MLSKVPLVGFRGLKKFYKTMSKISVNGKIQEVNTPISIIDLITFNNVAQPSMVSIQLNSQFVNRDDYENTQVSEGDEVDFLYFMGGGQY